MINQMCISLPDESMVSVSRDSDKDEIELFIVDKNGVKTNKIILDQKAINMFAVFLTVSADLERKLENGE